MSVSPPQLSLTESESLGVDRGQNRRQRLIALAGVVGALATSSCCIVPLLLFSLGISGAWIGNLTALAPYKPLFGSAAAGVLGYGFYLVYWQPKQVCAEDAACARPLPSRLMQVVLWASSVLVVAAFAFDYIAPFILNA
jgi:mercuric ion transport protein